VFPNLFGLPLNLFENACARLFALPLFPLVQYKGQIQVLERHNQRPLTQAGVRFLLLFLSIAQNTIESFALCSS